MGVPDYIIRSFGGLLKVPEYIRRHFQRRTQRQKDAEREARERLERERARIKALRLPPARVWRVGRTLMWEPPRTFAQLRPAGFWVSEQLPDGSWTMHGDYQLPDTREAQLRGDGAARVECYYNDTALGEHYYSPDVAAPALDPPMLVNQARYQASQNQKGNGHVELWRRVLAAFGVVEAKVGHAGRPPVSPLGPPMTAAEAQGLANRGADGCWRDVARALRRLEGIPEPAPAWRREPEPEPEAAGDAPRPAHTLSIAAGGRGSVGYNRILGFGRITDGSTGAYRTPSGKSVTLIHARSVGDELNFALSGAGREPADFPVRIVAARGSARREFVPQAGSLRPVRGGVRQDYDPVDGAVGDVFVAGYAVAIELYY